VFKRVRKPLKAIPSPLPMFTSMGQLVSFLSSQGLLDERLAGAFMKADRGCFVSHPLAYHPSMALPVVEGTTISAPDVVALMLSLLEPKGRVLDVGAGSGWTACLLSHLSDEVVAIDINERALEVARENLRRCCGADNVSLLRASAYSPPKGPYDRILVSASAPSFPKALERELKEGGVAVFVEGSRLVKARKEGGRMKREVELEGFAFLPLLP